MPLVRILMTIDNIIIRNIYNYLLSGTWFDILYRYVPTNPGKEQTWQKIFAARQELLRHFFCPTNQIVAKFDRHVSHSSENFYETLSEFLNFCILAVSWYIFRQCDLKKKTKEIV